VISRVRRSGRERGVAQRLCHRAGRVVALQVPCRQVDVQQQRSEAGVPGRRLPAGLAQHQAVDVDHEAGLLGDRDELGGRHQDAVRPRPSHQRLGRAHPPGTQVHDRLVVDDQLLALDGAAKGGGHVVAVAHQPQHGRLEHLVGALAAALGRVHGDVGVAQQLDVVRGGVLVVGDADAGADGDLPADHRVRRRQGGQHPFGEGADGRQVDALDQDRELVVAEAPDGVGPAKAAAQPGGDLLQQPVAGAVAHAVVDHLEVVEVDEEHGEAAAGAVGPGERVAHPVVEHRPVGEVGELVVEGLVLELRRQRLPLLQRRPQHRLGAPQLRAGRYT
jgi:hypothetical protein